MSRFASSPLVAAVAAVALTGCAGAPKVTRAPGEPPTPQSVTAANPGGDAFDPERAALERLLESPWGARNDKWKTFRAAMPDWRNWSTVNVFGFKPRAVYRYGEDNFAAGAIAYKVIEGPNDPERCLKKIVDDHLSTAQAFGIRPSFGEVVKTTYTFQGADAPMAIQKVEGSIENMFASDDYVGALAAYQSWPGTCFLYAFAVKSTHHPKLARDVRDRWVADGAPKTRWEAKLKEAPAVDPPDPPPPSKDEKKKNDVKKQKREASKAPARPPSKAKVAPGDAKDAAGRPARRRPNKLVRPKPAAQERKAPDGGPADAKDSAGQGPKAPPAPPKAKAQKPAPVEGGVGSTL